MKRVHNCVWHKSAPINKYRYLHYCKISGLDEWLRYPGNEEHGVGWDKTQASPSEADGGPQSPGSGRNYHHKPSDELSHSLCPNNTQSAHKSPGHAGNRLASEYERVRTK